MLTSRIVRIMMFAFALLRSTAAIAEHRVGNLELVIRNCVIENRKARTESASRS